MTWRRWWRRRLTTWIPLQEVTTAFTGVGDERVRARHAAVVLVAEWSDSRLRLPWEHTRETRRFRAAQTEPPFASAIREGEASERGTGQYESALRHYRTALDTARLPVQQTYARLKRALIAFLESLSGTIVEGHAPSIGR